MFYRRESDGHGFAKAPVSESKVVDELGTITHQPDSKFQQEMASLNDGAKVNGSFPEDLDSESQQSHSQA